MSTVPTTTIVSSTSAPTFAPKTRRMTLKRRRQLAGVVFALPAIALVVAFIGIPIGQAVYYSFTQWNGATSTWIGTSTWTQAFHNTNLWTALRNNGLLLLSVPFALALLLGIAVLLHQRVAGWRIFRSIYFMPTAISWVVLGLVAERFFAYQGTLNSIIHFLGFSHLSTNMLGYQSEALIALGITFVFTMIGTNTMLFLTGLATLDPSLEEAARIDGAGRWRIFRSITLPHLSRFIQLAFVMTVIALFSALFSLIFIMTGGGPGCSTATMEVLIYETGFQQSAFGTAALYGIILFVITAIVGIIQLRLIGSNE